MAEQWLLDAPSPLWAVLFWLLGGIWIVSEALLGKWGIREDAVESDSLSAPLLVFACALGVVLGFGCSAFGWLAIGVEWLRWFGLVLMAGGLALRIYSVLWLGPMFTRFVQIIPGHRLVTDGPYRLMRHPSYTGALVALTGLGLALDSWLSLGVLVLLPGAAFLYRIRVEERALVEAFGEEYQEYKSRVRMLLPFVL
jgi:protein-S-isoprenylcysteine O-methyltransferase